MSKHSSEHTKASSSEIHEPPSKMEKEMMELSKKKHSSQHTKASSSEIHEHPSKLEEEMMELSEKKHSSEHTKASPSEIHEDPSKMEEEFFAGKIMELSKKICSSIIKLFKKIHTYEHTVASPSEIHEHPSKMAKEMMELIKIHSSEHTKASPSEIAGHPSKMDEELLKGEIMELFEKIESMKKLFNEILCSEHTRAPPSKILEHFSKMKEEVSEFIKKTDSYERIKELFQKICIDREEKKKNCILSSAMRGDWKSFLHDVMQKPGLIKTALNEWKQTALHIAIAAGEDEIAKQLLEHVKQHVHDAEALYKKDYRGDTALHLAAALGMIDVCQIIIGVSPQLIFNQNEMGETPIFLAAAHGYAKTFFDFHLKSKALPENRADLDYCKREDGNTMLHCAIANDKFELARLVLKLYPSLATVHNSAGYTPLHILARKPTAFKSGTPLGTIERLFYWSGGKRLSSALASAVSIVITNLAGYFYGEKLKNMKQKHMLVEEIMVKLINVECWSTYHFKEEHLRIPFHDKRTVLWAIPKLPVSDSSVSSLKSMPPKLEPVKTLSRAVPWSNPLQPAKKKEKKSAKKEEEKKLVEMEGKMYQAGMYMNVPLPEPIGETPFLIAARIGVIEMVEAIHWKFPCAIDDKGASDGKNALLLAVENRQINVCDFLIKSVYGRKSSRKDVHKIQDKKRNNPLHLAANQSNIMQPWCIHGGIMKMLWEINWYQYVKDSFPFNFTESRNSDGKKPSEVFQDKHKVQMYGVEGGRLVTQASQYCSVIASLIATVAFTSANTFPGGNNEQGLPNFKGSLAFQLHMIFAILALCFSLMSLFIFLDLIFSPYQDAHAFNIRLMRKLALGLVCLFSSIVEMLISFFAGHFLIQTKAKLSPPLLVVWYCFASLLLFIIFILQFHSYPSLVLSVFRGKPAPWYRMDNIL